MPFLGFLHIGLLTALLLLSQRSSRLDWITKLAAAFIAGWSDLILTGLLLSPFSLLNHTLFYPAASLVLAVPFMLLLSWVGRVPVPAPVPVAGILDRMPLVLQRGLWGFLIATLVLALAGNLLIALAYLPNNPDTVAYRLPRIYWYWSAGSIAHFASGIDPRAIYYPLNGPLLQMPIVHYLWSARFFNFVPLLMWVIAGFTSFRVARELGFSRLTALAAAWLLCLTPGVLVQATSTNDEIIAATPLLIGMLFAVRFGRGLRYSDLAMAGLAAAVSAGTKLHIFFFWPLIPLALILLVVLKSRGAPWPALPPLRSRGGLALAAVALVSIPIAAAFALPNLSATGHLMAPGLSAGVLNTPFHLGAGVQNLVLHTAQTMLSPIPDANPASLIDDRRNFYAAFSTALSGLFTWVDQGPDYMSASYQFRGATTGAAWLLNENSIDIGFTYLLFAGALLLCLRHPRRFPAGLALGTALGVWYVTYCLSTKYIEGFSVYLGYVTIVCSPLIGYFLASTRPWSDAVRLVVLLLVIATHTLGAFAILSYNTSRNVIAASDLSAWPLNFYTLSPRLNSFMRRNDNVNFAVTHWEIPYWAMMREHKGARFTASQPANAKPDRLNLFPFQQFAAYGFVPVQVKGKATPGLTLVGDFRSNYGPEWAFVSGRGIDKKYPDGVGYIVLAVLDQPNAADPSKTDVSIPGIVAGMDSTDGLEFRYSLRARDGSEQSSDWSTDPARRLAKPADPQDAVLTVEVRPARARETVSTVDVPLYKPEPAKPRTAAQ